MTKLLLTGCFKKQRGNPSLKEFNQMTKAKNLMYIEIYTSLFEKNTMLISSENSTLHLSETQINGKKDEKIFKFKDTRKMHATMLPKTF